MGNGSATITEVHISSDPNYLTRLRRIVGCLADCAGMDIKEIQDAKLAVSEACANAIRHGSPRGNDDRIMVKFASQRGSVTAEVTDPGTGFDPENLPPRAETQPGGYGITLMRTLTDEVHFVKNRKGMTVKLVKRAKRGTARFRGR